MAGIFTLVGISGTILTTPDGTTYTARTSGVAVTLRGIVYVDELRLYVAVGDGGTILTSPDSINWTPRTSGTAADLRHVAWSPSLGRLVVVGGPKGGSGGNGVALWSEDGVDWEVAATPPFNTPDHVVWAESLGRFIAAGSAGTSGTNGVAISPDGDVWTGASFPSATAIAGGVAWSDLLGIGVVVLSNGSTWTSTNGTTWTAGGTVSSFSSGRKVRWDDDLERFLAAGQSSSGTNPGRVGHSTNGTTWSAFTASTIGSPSNTFASSAYSPPLNMSLYVGNSETWRSTNANGYSSPTVVTLPGAPSIEDVVWANPNSPPYAPVVTNPAPGQTFARNEPNTVAADFADPDPGDSPSRMIGQVRLDGETVPYYTWDVESPAVTHVIAANELSLGTNELRVMYHDAAGEPGEWSDWVPFNVADRSGPPTIISPTPGATIGSQRQVIGWSAAEQEAYRGRKREDVDGEPGDIIEGSDTGIVQSSGARQRTFEFPTNNVHEWVEIARRVDGLWSTYAQARYRIAYTPPATPTVTVTPGEGVITVTASHPTPVDDEPAVTQMHVWRRTADESPSEDPQSPKGVGVRLQRGFGLAPSASFVDGSVAGGVIYEYRVEAVGANEVVSFSDWTG